MARFARLLQRGLNRFTKLSSRRNIHQHSRKMSMENIEVCRVMMPDDANISGNVHGGTILKMIEEAGVIIATRHCNEGLEQKDQDFSCLAALARVERTDFLQPMFIGEVAKIHAELSYASAHSLEVNVYVWAENLQKCVKRLTNHAHLWYVPIRLKPTPGLGDVPPIKDLTEVQLKEGERRYLRQKKSRAERKLNGESSDLYNLRPQNMLTVSGSEDVPLHSVPYSQSTLISMVNPSDCNKFGYGLGGPAMKSMDTVAGIVAYRHCRTNVVTASVGICCFVESLDFSEPVKLGHVMTFTGRMVFTSNRSMEIEVFVDAEDVVNGKCFRCVSALFTYVSLDEKKNTQKVPQLVLRTEDEKRRFQEGQLRYESKKEERMRIANLKRQKMEN